MNQMRLVAARLLGKYKLTLDPGSGTEDSVIDDMKDQLTACPGRLTLVLEKV